MFRRALKGGIGGLVVGATMLGGAMAGVGLGPVEDPTDDVAATADAAGGGERLVALDAPPEGTFLVGTGAVELVPDPPEGRAWKTEGCQVIDDPSTWENLETTQTPWPQDIDCIYMGGFDIGPVRPANAYSDLGIWAKAAAVSDGTNTVIFGRIDGTGYFYLYDDGQCDDCGFSDVADALSAELGIPKGNIMFASTHSHAAPDFIGGWGGVPDWYLKQARDGMIDAGRQAFASMRAATVTIGDEVVRQFNSERRDFYRSATDAQLVWLRAADATTGDTILTVTNYAAHPTVLGSGNLTLHPDWPGATEARLEDEFPGSASLFFEGGLGNQSDSRGPIPDPKDGYLEAQAIGSAIAEIAIADMAAGVPTSGAVAGTTEEFLQPVTNVPLLSLGGGGFFDRAFEVTPAAGSWGENSNKPCQSGAPTVVRTAMGGFRIGDFALMFGSGELFSNLTASVKDALWRANQVMVASLANDELGYLIQSFEFEEEGQQGTGFFGEVVEYEEAFGIDRCFGDRVVEGLIEAGHDLGF